MQQLLAELQGVNQNGGRAAWQVSNYKQLFPPLQNALKSITGRTFNSATQYMQWWEKEGKDFKVIDN